MPTVFYKTQALFNCLARKSKNDAIQGILFFSGGNGKKNNVIDDKATTGATYLSNFSTIHNTTHTLLQYHPAAAVTNSGNATQQDISASTLISDNLHFRSKPALKNGYVGTSPVPRIAHTVW